MKDRNYTGGYKLAYEEGLDDGFLEGSASGYEAGKNFFSDRVREFHEAFGHPVADKPSIPSADRYSLRLELIREEAKEFAEAHNLLEAADALADLLYVIHGAALEFGIPLAECFAEVHRSNMSKLGEDGKPIYREDGKVLKGTNFKEPDLKKILEGK